MHEAALARAAMPQPAVCLGLLLRPYSIGHHLLLTGGGLLDCEPTLPHLAHAVLICCQNWRENQRMAFDRLLDFKLWIWRWRTRRALGDLLGTELAKFRAYLEAGSTEFPLSDAPRPAQYSSSPRQTGSPFLLRLQQLLMLQFGLGEDEAWDYPFALAKMRWCAYWEQEGALDIYSEADAEFDRFVAEQEAKGQKSLEPKVSGLESATQDARHKTQDFPEPDNSHNQPSAEN